MITQVEMGMLEMRMIGKWINANTQTFSEKQMKISYKIQSGISKGL